ncbi:MAG: DNA-3-methyladenine glycosylase II [Acidobacteria bacterium OLB17]|nr:MAG: DNA-3-methyladenine glycosylase II [Acidobacteria bacterium OLB17]MCZ2391454.1 DNA-3-methyladenine glycosylase 2 family protein [Acidobacteriota bacterium]
MIERLGPIKLRRAVAALADAHPEFGRVFSEHGFPPLWDRTPGFATLLQIILEQQVSLASAKACFDKLERRLGEVTPEAFLTVNDRDLKRDGFSRQKAAYGRGLAETILEGKLDLAELERLPDHEVKERLIAVKGIGHWTVDIYLLMALLRPDVMPKGDIALHSAYKTLAGLGERPHADEFLAIAERWRPHRSVAARLLWHFYLCEKQ